MYKKAAGKKFQQALFHCTFSNSFLWPIWSHLSPGSRRKSFEDTGWETLLSAKVSESELLLLPPAAVSNIGYAGRSHLRLRVWAASPFLAWVDKGGQAHLWDVISLYWSIYFGLVYLWALECGALRSAHSL
jgi:hypothetical protein